MGKGKFKPTSSSTTTADRAKPTSKSKFKPALAAPLSPPSPAQEAQSEAIESSPEAASSPEREPISPITPKHPSINPTSKAKSKSIFPTPSSPPAPAGVLMHPNDIFVGMEDSYIPLSLSSSSDPFSIDERDPYALSGVDYDTSSPTKSLSSLAESDDEEDEGESSFKGYKGIESIELSQDFHPPFASTQNGSAGQGGKFGWMGYSSQVDVDHQVNEVDKLLERDVDYDGWLRDPSLDPEEV
ncbi:hypothetical protein BDQ17DRAFT_1421856 [Cyathus striatus]|nr:hypothetical protein BDQ17DRAFT_1421856 [Cyathus striatus]